MQFSYFDRAGRLCLSLSFSFFEVWTLVYTGILSVYQQLQVNIATWTAHAWLACLLWIGSSKEVNLGTIWGSWVRSCNTYVQHLCSYFGCCLSVQVSVSKLSDFVLTSTVYIGVCTACFLNSRLRPVINIIFFSLKYEVCLACLFAD